MKTAEEIVRALASYEVGDDVDACAAKGFGVCKGSFGYPREHDVDCPYRMAREWVEANPAAQASLDRIRESLRRRNLWIDAAGDVVELCNYHGADPRHDHARIEVCDPKCAWFSAGEDDPAAGPGEALDRARSYEGQNGQPRCVQCKSYLPKHEPFCSAGKAPARECVEAQKRDSRVYEFVIGARFDVDDEWGEIEASGEREAAIAVKEHHLPEEESFLIWVREPGAEPTRWRVCQRGGHDAEPSPL